MPEEYTPYVEGFYTLADGRFVELTSDRGPKYGVVVRDFWGNLLDSVKGLVRREKSFTAAEVWDLTEGGRAACRGSLNQSRVKPTAIDRLMTTFERLLEFGLLKVNCRGYYRNGTCDISESLAFGLLRVFDSAEVQIESTAFLAWILDPSPQTWAPFALPVNRRMWVDRTCPVTNLRFTWNFDGVCFTPVQRMIHEDEQTAEEVVLSLAPDKDGNSPTVPRIVFRDIEDFPHADGHLPAMTLELDCPTGKLVFANNLYDVFGDGNLFEFDICSEQGRVEQSQHLLALGAWHVFTPNRRCVCQNGNTIQIGAWLEGGEVEPPAAPWVEMGSLDGDLRWFYACDEGTLTSSWEKGLADPDAELLRIVVEPGRYRLTNHGEHHREDRLNCVIERIGPVGG